MRVGAVLVDEAEKSAADSEERLRRALALRLTRDIRRLDYVALFDPSGRIVFGDLESMPSCRKDAFRVHGSEHSHGSGCAGPGTDHENQGDEDGLSRKRSD